MQRIKIKSSVSLKPSWYEKHKNKEFEAADKMGSFQNKPAFRVSVDQVPEFKESGFVNLLVMADDAEVIKSGSAATVTPAEKK